MFERSFSSPLALLIAAALLFGGAAAPAQALTVRNEGDSTPSTRIVNCVSNDRIAFRPGHTGTWLDARERERVTVEMFTRYPMLISAGLVPTAIVLWHKPQGDWLFAALLDHPQRPGTPCFAAHVVADDFELMPALMKKYFPGDVTSL